MNPLGDGHTQALACLLSASPLLATLSLQGCKLTARFLQQHRLLLASALAGNTNLIPTSPSLPATMSLCPCVNILDFTLLQDLAFTLSQSEQQTKN